MQITAKITPCLWFDNQGEEAAKFYTGIFRNSKILGTTRYGEAGKEMHGQKPGTAMTVAFELDGQPFTALNGGPMYKFTEAISLQVMCDNQQEVDHYWNQLGAGGDEKAQQCGWLKDRYGVSWQVVPRVLPEMIAGTGGNTGRMMGAMMKMKKLDIAQLERAYQTH
jgi:predicted 3-demethylubiquinone-9 3-methyltransferase (glyoxalase superfamily)